MYFDILHMNRTKLIFNYKIMLTVNIFVKFLIIFTNLLRLFVTLILMKRDSYKSSKSEWQGFTQNGHSVTPEHQYQPIPR